MLDLTIKAVIGVLALTMALILFRSRNTRHRDFRRALNHAVVGALAVFVAKVMDVIIISAGLLGMAGPTTINWTMRLASIVVTAGLVGFVAAAAQWLAASKRLSSQNEAFREHRDRLRAVSEDNSLALSTVPAILYRSSGPLKSSGNNLEILNDNIEDILGYTVAELEASPDIMFGLMHPDDRKDYEARHGQAVMSQPRTILEQRFRHKNGEYRWIRRHISRIVDAQGNFKELIGCGVDITDLKDAEQRLLDFLDSAPDAVITIDRHHVIVLASTRATTLFGYSKEELIGRHVRDLIPADEHINLGDPLPIPDLSESDFQLNSDIELYGRRNDGSVFPAEIRISAIQGKGARFAALAFRDISDRKETEAKLLQAQKMEAVGQLTGGIAHDFNNMLMVILGNLQMLESAKDGDRARRYLQAAMQGTDRASALTSRLLAFSRQQVLRPARVGVSELITGLDPLLRRVLGEDMTLNLQIDEGLSDIYVDAAQLENSLLNLSINARDAMVSGGQLTIAASNCTVDDQDASDDLAAGEYVKISVTDTGVGIPGDALPHIFEPFYTTKEVGKGSGLGLSMVYGFVAQSRGHVAVSSIAGNGTTFEVYLRKACGGPRAIHSPAYDEERVPEGNEQILLVEDNSAVRETASELLKSLNYRVLPVDTPSHALELFENRSDVDLLFTDLVMPGRMNGIQLAAEVRKRKPDLKVLFTTGYANSTSIANGHLGPHDMILDKPYRRATLARTVRDALDQE